VQKLPEADGGLDRERQCGYLDREVRQGGSLVIPVPGANPAHPPVVKSGSPDLIVTTRVVGQSVVVDLKARHGATLGESPDHKVTIDATIAGRPYKREFIVLVQAIAASPEGLDTNEGSEREPFRTFRKAVSVAETGDTIVLRNTEYGFESEPGELRAITIPAGVTVRGQVPLPKAANSNGLPTPQANDDTAPSNRLPTGGNGTILSMPIELAGGATLDNLVLKQHLALTAPDKTVKLNDVEAEDGVSVAASATTATLVISGQSKVMAKDPRANPILVEADDATLWMGGLTNVDHGAGRASAPVVKMAGHRQHLSVHGDVRIQGITFPVAIQVDDAQTVEIEGRAKDSLRILGRVELTGVDAMLTVKNASFPWGINGGSGIVFKGGGMSSQARIESSEFQGEGLLLSGLNSRATFRDTRFMDIATWGIRVDSGTLDLGTGVEAGGNQFWTTKPDPADLSSAKPVALRIDAKVGQASVTSSATTYDGQNPGRCEIPGPTKEDVVQRGFVKIADAITLQFYP
jgi:hypothetical protein